MKDNLSFIVEAEKKKLNKPKRAAFVHPNFSVSELKKKRKEDALALAQLIYDVYKEERQR
jgi:hypothetical protein